MSTPPNTRIADRNAVTIPATYRTGTGVRRDVTLTDISATGARFYEKIGYLPRGALINIRIDGMGPFDAAVVWQSSGDTGIQFAKPLYGPILDHIVTQLNTRGGL